jgi:CheY-like chemotaxis protein
VESQPGQGAVFSIELPVEAPAVVEPERGTVGSLPPVQWKTILIVDDEPDVAGTLADLLRLEGHQVETAPNGVIALEKLRERSYDLVMSDIRMPELDGPGLYRELERRDARLLQRLIFLTGDALSRETAEFLGKTGVTTLSKPFVLPEVRAMVQRMLRNRPGGGGEK